MSIGNGGPDLRRRRKGLAAWLIFCAVLSLGLLGVIARAVVALVTHFA